MYTTLRACLCVCMCAWVCVCAKVLSGWARLIFKWSLWNWCVQRGKEDRNANDDGDITPNESKNNNQHYSNKKPMSIGDRATTVVANGTIRGWYECVTMWYITCDQERI